MPDQSTLAAIDEQLPTVVVAWWRGLDNDKGDRAQLRRCKSPVEATFIPATHALYRNLQPLGFNSRESIAVLAGVLSHIQEHVPGRTFAQQMAAGEGKKARVSGLRFRRLLKHETRDQLSGPLIRIIGLLGGAANVASLAHDLLYWGDHVRRSWACEYYDAAPAEES